jgi:tetratricopeptide (TPR) repeat protein
MTQRCCLNWIVLCLVLLGAGAAVLRADEDESALFKQAQALETQKKFAEADAIYSKLIDTNPTEPALYIRRGWVRHLLKDDPAALHDLDLADIIKPKDPATLLRRGLIHEALDDPNKAEQDFRAVVAADPKNPRARYELAMTLRRTARHREALAFINESIALDPKRADYVMLRSAIHEKLGEGTEALADADLARTLTTDPKLLAAIDQNRPRLAALAANPHPEIQPGGLLPNGRPAAAKQPIAPASPRVTKAEPTPASQEPAISSSVPSATQPAEAGQTPSVAGEVSFAKDTPAPSTAPATNKSRASAARSSSAARFAPIQVPAPMDLSNLNAQQWAGIVAQTKEGMAMIFGELSTDQQKAFDQEWAPYFEFPCKEVLDYFQKLAPLVAEFVQVKEAYGRTALATDKAQAELLSAIATEDAEEIVSLSQDLKHFRGILGACTGRITQLAAEVGKLGAAPKPLELKKQAKKRHAKIIDDILMPDAATVGTIEGTWVGSTEGKSGSEKYTYKIEAQLSGDLLLVRKNRNEPILLEPLPQGNAWLCVEIEPGQEPADARLSRLEIRDGKLLRRIFEPVPPSALLDYRGPYRAFKTKVYARGNPPGTSEESLPLPAVDDDGKPINWKKTYSDCILARAAEIRVLREGGLPSADEPARRHTYATQQAEPGGSEFYAVVTRMALEKGIEESAVDHKEALTRTYERYMNEQQYYYGDQPPGFDNLKWFDVSIPVERGVRPDIAARIRREGMLAWNLRKNLEVRFKRVERYEGSLAGLSLTPEGIAAFRQQNQKLATARRAEIARLRAEQADEANRNSPPEYYEQQIQALNRDIAKLASDDYIDETRERLAQAQKKEEADYMLPARIVGISAQLDEELPTTAGRVGLSASAPSATGGGTSLELPERMSEVSPDKKIVAAVAEATLPPAPPMVDPVRAKQEADALAKKEAEKLEQQTKEAKKAFLKEEIASNLRSVEVLQKSIAAAAASAMPPQDKERELNNLQRSIQQLRSWNQTAEDNIRFVDTGVYERTRTPSDELNAQLMREDSRAQANYWDNINSKIVRMNRLIDTAAPDARDDLRRRWNDELETEIKGGAKFENIDAAARAIGDAAIKTRQAEQGQADQELAVTERNLAIAEGVKTAAGYSMTAVTMYATAGLASPVSIFMPTCAETAISTTYSIATGYIEGGPEAAFKQAAGAYSQAAGLFSTAMDAYQQGVLDHLEDYARDPRNKKLNETGAGLSAMGWALAKEGVQNAATHFVVNPILANTKEALKGPAKFATGAFGKDPMTFKSAAQMADERRFNDKSLYGKHLMMQFKQAHEELQTAKTSGKTPAEINAAKARMDDAYKEANSDFHAKNWMKRTAKLNEELGVAWAQTDGVHKAELMKVTAELNRAAGLSTPPMKSYSNSASKGGVGMDLDLGFEEPARWKQVADPGDKNKTITIVNPEYWAWRNKLVLTDSNGVTKRISPREYSQKAHENMAKAYEKVYGRKPDEAFLEFTFADHPEAYKDKAWLGKEKKPADQTKSGVDDKTEETPWADFASVNPAWAVQAADVTAFKVYRLQKADAKGGPIKSAGAATKGPAAGAAPVKEEFPGMPRYSAMLEQCRGLVKDFDTKMIGAKADTSAFGNEDGNKITINPESPLARTPPEVQKHFLELRTVLNDFANGKLRPSEAEMKLNVLTGGQGVVEIPEQMRAVMNRFAQEPRSKK